MAGWLDDWLTDWLAWLGCGRRMAVRINRCLGNIWHLASTKPPLPCIHAGRWVGVGRRSGSCPMYRKNNSANEYVPGSSSEPHPKRIWAWNRYFYCCEWFPAPTSPASASASAGWPSFAKLHQRASGLMAWPNSETIVWMYGLENSPPFHLTLDHQVGE